MNPPEIPQSSEMRRQLALRDLAWKMEEAHIAEWRAATCAARHESLTPDERSGLRLAARGFLSAARQQSKHVADCEAAIALERAHSIARMMVLEQRGDAW